MSAGSILSAVALVAIGLGIGLILSRNGTGAFGVPDIIAATLSGVVGGGVLSVWFQAAWNWWCRPKLQVRIERGHPAFEADTPVIVARADAPDIELPSRWLRLVVRNTGRSAAKSCQVFITRFQVYDKLCHPTRKSLTADWSDTLPLCWAVRDGQTAMDLVPNVDFAVDFARGIPLEFGSDLRLLTPFEPFRYRELLRSFGSFSVRGVAAAENARPIEFFADFRWNGDVESLVWTRDVFER